MMPTRTQCRQQLLALHETSHGKGATLPEIAGALLLHGIRCSWQDVAEAIDVDSLTPMDPPRERPYGGDGRRWAVYVPPRADLVRVSHYPFQGLTLTR